MAKQHAFFTRNLITITVACLLPLLVITHSQTGDSTTCGIHGINQSDPLNLGDTASAELNGSTTELNYTLSSLSELNRYDFQLSVPTGCDFNLILLDTGDQQVASSTQAVTGPMNESIWFKPAVSGSFTAVITRISGDGIFNFTVTEHVNTGAPIVSNTTVTPNNTIIFTPYTFYAWYNDSDGFEPEVVNLVLNGSIYPMTLDGSMGTNYTSGVRYYRNFSKLEAGIHEFQCNASDGFISSLTPVKIVNVSKPSSTLVDLGSAFYEPFNEGFNNSVGWINTTTRSSWELHDTTYRSSPTCMGIQTTGTIIDTTEGNIRTPLFELAPGQDYKLVLGYHVALFAIVELEINVNLTNSWETVGFLTYIDGDWIRYESNITEYAGSFVRFRFNLDAFGGQHLYIDDFYIGALEPAPILDPLSNRLFYPSSGNQFTVYHCDVTYTNPYNNYPEELYLSIYDGDFLLGSFIKEVNFNEVDDQDWDVTDGKAYTCQFQLLEDIDDLHITIVCDWYGSLLPWFEDITAIGNVQQPIETVDLPFSIDFETGTVPYYIINDPSIDRARVINDGGEHYFTTGAALDTVATVMDLGLVTPMINLSSDIQLFLEFDSVIDYNDIGGADVFTVDASTDGGYTWTQLIRYNSSSDLRRSINVTMYRDQVTTFRFLLSTNVVNIGAGTHWYIDNIAITKRDFTPPVLESINLQDGKRVFGKYDVRVQFSDVGFGVQRVLMIVDGDTYANVSITNETSITLVLDSENFSNGEHDIDIVLIDASDNEYTYTVMITTDKRPYLLVGIIAGSIAVAFGVVMARLKKKKVSLRELPGHIKKKITEKEREPPRDVMKEILSLTSIYRSIAVEALAAKIQSVEEGIKPNMLGSYIRYMLSEGLIKGSLEGNIFKRHIFSKKRPGTKKDMIKLLKEQEDAIVKKINEADEIPVQELLSSLKLTMVGRAAFDDFILDLIRKRKVNCFFDGDIIVNEGFDEKDIDGRKQDAIKITDPHLKEEPVNLLEQHGQKIITILKDARNPVPFDTIRSQIGTRTVNDDVLEEFLFKMIKESNLEGRLEPGLYIPPAPTLQSLEDEVIEMLQYKPMVKFSEVKEKLGLKEDEEAIEDFIFDLIRDKKVSGSLEPNSFKRD
ncbi:hypothetical protein GF325_07950 [Candidatus Bathyarchaeota archaeon]|nr:hypothetical protein [Candidatus Bathyarchaeota archaeon]